MRRGFRPNLAPRHKLNNQISAPEVRVLDETGKQVGILPISDALTQAHELGIDLVEIAGQATPPVVKLIDYKKFLYQEKKRKQEEKKNAHVSETKQIRFGPFIGEHDLGIKVERAREFIKEGDKVKFIIKFQGRAITKQDLGRGVLEKVVKDLEDIAKIEREIHMEGRQMVVTFSKETQKKKEEAEEDSAQTQNAEKKIED